MNVLKQSFLLVLLNCKKKKQEKKQHKSKRNCSVRQHGTWRVPAADPRATDASQSVDAQQASRLPVGRGWETTLWSQLGCPYRLLSRQGNTACRSVILVRPGVIAERLAVPYSSEYGSTGVVERASAVEAIENKTHENNLKFLRKVFIFFRCRIVDITSKSHKISPWLQWYFWNPNYFCQFLKILSNIYNTLVFLHCFS